MLKYEREFICATVIIYNKIILYNSDMESTLIEHTLAA